MAMKKRGAVGRPRSKETRKLLQAIAAAGGEVERTGRGHLKVTGPAGVAIVGSDIVGNAAWRNTLQTLRVKAGLDLDLPN